MDNSTIESYLGKINSNIKHKNNNFFNIKCPLCNEGHSTHKARGYVLLGKEVPVYFCHNCLQEGISFRNFLFEVNPDVASSWDKLVRKEHVSGYKQRKNEFKETQKLFSTTNTLPDTPQELEKERKEDTPVYSLNNPKKVFFDTLEFRKGDFKKQYDIHLLDDDVKAYLIGRGFTSEDFKYFLYQRDLNAIITPFWYNIEEGLVYGFQSRSLEQKFFFNQNYEVNPKVWNLYECLSLPKGTKVYVFEGVFDAISTSLEHKIAVIGKTVGKEILNEFKQRGIELVFCTDNDETGRASAIRYSKEGYSVLVHSKKMKLKDFNEMLQYGFSKELITEYILTNIHKPKMAMYKLRLDRR